MTEPGEWRKVANVSLLLEPKEEPLDDFQSMSADIEEKASNKSTLILKRPKDEPLDISYDNELSFKEDTSYKKEEMLDYNNFSHDGAVNESIETEISPLFHVEPKLEDLEDRVVIAVENPYGLELYDDFRDEATLSDNNVRRRGHYSKDEEDEELASSSGLPVSARAIVEMPTSYLNQLLRMDSLSELQLQIIRSIRRRGRHRNHERSAIERVKNEAKNIDKSHFPNLTDNRRKGGLMHRLDGRDDHRFKIHNQELFDKSFATPPCILCDKYRSTVHGYISHLIRDHNSTLKSTSVYLVCSCGFEVYGRSRVHKKCGGIEFSLHNLHDKTRMDLSQLKVKNIVPSTPQCILCENYPSTAYGYATHLQFHHKSTLNKEKIFLLCSCGHQIRSASRSFNHMECDAREFTIEMNLPINYDHSYCLPPR